MSPIPVCLELVPQCHQRVLSWLCWLVTSQKQGTGEVFGVANQNGVCASLGVVRAVPYEEATRDLVLDGKGECMLLDFSGLVLSDHF